MQKFKKYFPIALILITAFFLRLLILFKYGNLWSDEWFSITYSQKPWYSSLTKFWIWETNPPLHMIFLKAWFYIAPVTEFWARTSSTIISLLSIATLYILNKKLFNEKIALVSAAILSVTPVHLFFSATVRAYALLLLFTIISTYYFFTIFYSQEKTKKNILLFILFTTLLLYTHLTATLVLASQFIALLITNRTQIKQWIKQILLPVVFLLVWAIPSLTYKLTFNTVQNGWFFNIKSNYLDVVEKIASLFIGYTDWKIGILALFVFGYGTYLLIKKQRQSNQHSTIIVIYILFLFPICCALFLNLLNIKFFLITLPWSITLTAYLLHTFNKKYIGHFIIYTLLTINAFSLYKSLPLNNWQPVDSYINQRYNSSTKQLIIYNSFTQKHEVEHYLTTQIPAYAYVPRNTDWDNYLITNNYLRYIHPDSEIKKWLNDYQIHTFQEIILLDDKDVGIDIAPILLQQNWHEQEPAFKAPLAANVYVRYFKK